MSQATSASAIAKREARNTGRTKYEGRRCKQCRPTVRYTSSSACCACSCVRSERKRAEVHNPA